MRKTDNKPWRVSLSWDSVAELLTTHQERRVKDGPMFSPATFKPGSTRANKNVQAISLLVADLDKGGDFETLQERLVPYAHVIYSTYGYTPANGKIRVVILLSRAVEPDRYADLWQRSQEHLFFGQNDEATKALSQAYYLPSCPPGAAHVGRVYPGRVLDPDELPRASVPTRRCAAQLPGKIYEHEGRNNRLFSLACSDRHRGLEEDEILQRLRVVNVTRCVPRLDDQELAAIARSACRYEPGVPLDPEPPSPTNVDEVDPAVLHAQIGRLERRLTRMDERLEHKNRMLWEKSQRDRDERAMLRNPNLRAGEKLSLLVALRDIDSEAHWGRRGPDSMAMVTAARVARETGQSEDAVAKHFAVGVQVGVLRHEVRTVPIRVLDPTTGEYRDELRNATFLGTVQSTTSEAIRALAVAPKPTKKDGTPRGKWGGLHEHCPEHPNAAFTVGSYVCCAECGRPLHPKHYVAPDRRPIPQDADLVDEPEWGFPWLRLYSVQDADLVSPEHGLVGTGASSPAPLESAPVFEPNEDDVLAIPWGLLKEEWAQPPPVLLGFEGPW